MDFEKVFDKVPHMRLLHKLDYYGIRDSAHKWISSWLSGRSQQRKRAKIRNQYNQAPHLTQDTNIVLYGQASDPVSVLSEVVLDGQASDPVSVLSDVPQWLIYGPILFLIFINDLPDNMNSSVLLFECILTGTFILCKTVILQEDLDSLALWEADWQMKFKIAKCHSMRVTRHYSYKFFMTTQCTSKLWKMFSPQNILA